MEESIGSILKAAREAKNLTIEQAAEETAYRKEFLKAIEDDNFQAFPADIYIKGTLRGYGNYLGLNGLELVDMYKAHEANTTVDKVRTLGIREVDNVKMNISLKQEPGVGTQTNFSKEKHPLPIKEIAMGAFLIVILFGMYFTIPKYFKNDANKINDKPETEIISTTNFFSDIGDKLTEIYYEIKKLVSNPTVENNKGKIIQPSENKKDATSINKKSEESQINVTAKPQEGSKQQTIIPAKKKQPKTDPNAIMPDYDKRVIVEMTASGQCWIDVYADGKAVYSGMMVKGRYKIFEAKKRITVKYGNIGVMQIIVNGKAINMRGEEGVAVRHYPR